MTQHILIVDDDRTHRALLGEIIKEQGFKVTAVDNARSGLNKLAKAPQKFALVIMDLEMPGFDGLQAVAGLLVQECEERRPRIPVIAFTAHTEAEDRLQCFEAGMDDYMSKDAALTLWRDMVKAKLDLWVRALV